MDLLKLLFPDESMGTRPDGSLKDVGFLGKLARPDKSFSTELGITVNLGGEDVNLPLLVPTLKKQEINWLLEGNTPTKDIVTKAVEHAKDRLGQGLSPFYISGVDE